MLKNKWNVNIRIWVGVGGGGGNSLLTYKCGKFYLKDMKGQQSYNVYKWEVSIKISRDNLMLTNKWKGNKKIYRDNSLLTCTNGKFT